MSVAAGALTGGLVGGLVGGPVGLVAGAGLGAGLGAAAGADRDLIYPTAGERVVYVDRPYGYRNRYIGPNRYYDADFDGYIRYA